MAILTVSIKLKVYSQTSWYTLTHVTPPKSNTADQAESGNAHQILIQVFKHHRKCTKESTSDYTGKKFGSTLRLLVP